MFVTEGYNILYLLGWNMLLPQGSIVFYTWFYFFDMCFFETNVLIFLPVPDVSSWREIAVGLNIEM